MSKPITDISHHPNRRAMHFRVPKRRDRRTAQNMDPITGSFTLTPGTFACLRIFTDEGPHYVMSQEEALQVDQRRFGAVYHHGYIRYNETKKGFVATQKGRDAARQMSEFSVFKEEAGTNFSSFIPLIQALNGHNARRQTA